MLDKDGSEKMLRLSGTGLQRVPWHNLLPPTWLGLSGGGGWGLFRVCKCNIQCRSCLLGDAAVAPVGGGSSWRCVRVFASANFTGRGYDVTHSLHLSEVSSNCENVSVIGIAGWGGRRFKPPQSIARAPQKFSFNSTCQPQPPCPAQPQPQAAYPSQQRPPPPSERP